MDKRAIYFGGSIGGVIGGYLPSLFGADGFSAWGIIGSTIGGIIGIYVVYKLLQ